jgi:hypothetical protein
VYIHVMFDKEKDAPHIQVCFGVSAVVFSPSLNIYRFDFFIPTLIIHLILKN